MRNVRAHWRGDSDLQNVNSTRPPRPVKPAGWTAPCSYSVHCRSGYDPEKPIAEKEPCDAPGIAAPVSKNVVINGTGKYEPQQRGDNASDSQKPER